MKAYNLHGIGRLEYEEMPLPECPPNWCIVKVKAAGICSSDIPRIFKKGTYHFPTIPGHEFAGIVTTVADKRNELLVGKRVGIFPLIPCRKCKQCLKGAYELCDNYDYLGSRRDGGFAEYVAVPAWNLIEIDDKIDFIDAAMMEPLAVSLHAIKQLNIVKDEHVGIVGTGMIAFAAAQWAKRIGAAVTVIGRSEEKHVIADILGIKYIVSSDLSGRCDAVLEAVGSNSSIETALNIVRTGGRVVLMGNPGGDILLKQDIYWKILRKQLTVRGTWNSSYENNAPCDWQDVKNSLFDKSIKVRDLISHVFPQERLIEGLELMYEHKEPYCKVMTIWNEV